MQVLSDEGKRKIYERGDDPFAPEQQQQQGWGPGGGFPGGFPGGFQQQQQYSFHFG